MRKMRIILHSLAIIVAATAAIASSKAPSKSRAQYYLRGEDYVPAGTYGVDYVCEAGTGVCTYYYDEVKVAYVPSRIGKIAFLR